MNHGLFKNHLNKMTFGWKTSSSVMLSIRSKTLPLLRHSNCNPLIFTKNSIVFGPIKSLHKLPKETQWDWTAEAVMTKMSGVIYI